MKTRALPLDERRRRIGLLPRVPKNMVMHHFPTAQLALRHAAIGNNTMSIVQLKRTQNAPTMQCRRGRTLKAVANCVLMLVRLHRAIVAKRAMRKADELSRRKSRRGSQFNMSRRASHAFTFLSPNGPSGNEDDDMNLIQQGYFPAAKDLADLPETVVDAIYDLAQQSITRCIDIMKKNKKLAEKRARQTYGTKMKIDSSLWGKTFLFDGWPQDILDELLSFGHIDHFCRGELLFYYNEPTVNLHILLEGEVVFVDKVNPSIKPVNAEYNGKIVDHMTGPNVIRETAIIVEEHHTFAVQAASLTDVLIIPVQAVLRAFQRLPESVKKFISKKYINKRIELMRKRGVPNDLILQSEIFKTVSETQLNSIKQALHPMSFLEGSELLNKDATDAPHDKMYFVDRGTITGTMEYKTPKGNWEELVFAYWQTGQCFGEKVVYFKEKYLFNLVAKTHVDVWALHRQTLNQLLAGDKFLKQCVADGAYAIRAGDPTVRLMFRTTRSIPCIKEALKRKLLTEFDLRYIHSLFEFRIFPSHELITSTSKMITEMLVIMVGKTIVNVNQSTNRFPLPLGEVLGVSAVNSMRWRFAAQATTPCEGWVLPVAKLKQFLEKRGVLKQIQFYARRNYHMLMRSDNVDEVLEVEAPISIDAATERKQRIAQEQREAEEIEERRKPVHTIDLDALLEPTEKKLEASANSVRLLKATSNMSRVTSFSGSRRPETKLLELSELLASSSESSVEEDNPPYSVSRNPSSLVPPVVKEGRSSYLSRFVQRKLSEMKAEDPTLEHRASIKVDKPTDVFQNFQERRRTTYGSLGSLKAQAFRLSLDKQWTTSPWMVKGFVPPRPQTAMSKLSEL